MFSIIQQIIDHTWVTQNAGDQTNIYYICSALICLLTVVFIDLMYRVITRFWR